MKGANMKKAYLIGMSDGKKASDRARLQQVCRQIQSLNLFDEVIIHPSVYVDRKTNRTLDPVIRGEIFMQLATNPDTTALFDVSGGELCNGVLPYLDWEKLANCNCTLYGYSDVSVLLNAIADKTTIKVWYFPVMTVENSEIQLKKLQKTLIEPISFMESLRGGNVRCTLKMAGTQYFSKTSVHTWLFESFSGRCKRIESSLTQYEQLGVFQSVKKVVVGRFNEIEENGEVEQLHQLFFELQKRYSFELEFREDIGHILEATPVFYG